MCVCACVCECVWCAGVWCAGAGAGAGAGACECEEEEEEDGTKEEEKEEKDDRSSGTVAYVTNTDKRDVPRSKQLASCSTHMQYAHMNSNTRHSNTVVLFHTLQRTFPYLLESL